ncbi:MAG: pyridoxal phosphate-dependent aminotransferase [Hyphomicrobiaceae bacterium]
MAQSRPTPVVSAAPIETGVVAELPASVPFVGPEALERRRGAAFRARLGANESVFGPSPRAVEAMTRAARDVWMYGDPELHDLRHDLSAHHGVHPEEIVVGGGIDGLLGLACRLVVEPGLGVVTSLGAYPTFNYHVAGFGGVLTRVPYVHDREDLDGLAAAVIATDARLVYVANPDNPMGSWWPAEAVTEFLDRVPPTTLICLDEAYADTAPAEALPQIDTSRPNLLRLRTFSKAYGLAGLRVGYGIGARHLVQSFNKIRNHFGVGRIAQEGARAALADQAHLAATVERIGQARAKITAIARANGLSALPSATNFVAIDCGADGAFAKAVLEALAEDGVFVRMPGVAPLDRCIRVSVGTPELLDIFNQALPLALGRVRSLAG